MEISRGAAALLRRLEDAGFEAYAVGGCVRDLLLGREIADWDITTNARPEQVLALFGARAVPTGLAHGTVTVRTDDGAFEVTTYRVDGAYSDHRRPDRVAFTGRLRDDLARRDFTVNAMALDLRGTLIDPFGGRGDLHRRTLRCVGDAKARFSEDALRILRALRFSATLCCSIEVDTEAALKASAHLLREIAAERVCEELLKLLCGENAVDVLLRYPDVLGVVLPEILPAVGLDQRNIHHCYTVWEHTARAVGYAPRDAVLRMSALLHDLGKPVCMTVDADGVGHFYGHGKISAALAHDIVRRLRFDKRSSTRILKLVEYHDAPIVPQQRAVRRVLNRFGADGTRDLLALKRADNLAQAPQFHTRQKELDTLEELIDTVLAQDACFSLKQLAVKGGDIMALGFCGPQIGEVLRGLLRAVLDGQLPNERDALLRAAQDEYGRKTPQ